MDRGRRKPIPEMTIFVVLENTGLIALVSSSTGQAGSGSRGVVWRRSTATLQILSSGSGHRTSPQQRAIRFRSRGVSQFTAFVHVGKVTVPRHLAQHFHRMMISAYRLWKDSVLRGTENLPPLGNPWDAELPGSVHKRSCALHGALVTVLDCVQTWVFPAARKTSHACSRH